MSDPAWIETELEIQREGDANPVARDKAKSHAWCGYARALRDLQAERMKNAELERRLADTRDGLRLCIGRSFGRVWNTIPDPAVDAYINSAAKLAAEAAGETNR